MIRGYFSTSGSVSRPYVYCDLDFPSQSEIGTVGVDLLLDTGADRTILSPLDAERIGLDLSKLDVGRPSRGVGGRVSTRLVESRLSVQGYTTVMKLYIPETRQPIPSLLGRDFISDFALFIEDRTDRVLLLDQSAVASLGLTASDTDAV